MIRKTVLALLLAAAGVNAHAALSAGDIAFTSFNADEDGWSIVALSDIAANSTIYFSDNEWNGSAFNTGEGYMTWDTGAANIVAGSLVRFSAVDKATRAATSGTITGTGDNGINATNETIYAYLGASATSPTSFLAGISSEGATNLAPAGLAAGSTAVVVTNSTDYAAYIGPRSGQTTYSAYASLINNSANWVITVGGDQAAMVPDTTSFSVMAVPEPKNYAMFLAGLGLMGLIARRQSNR
ncbi:PEP-CTERM sorting domain-containing protein [Ferribacterium limneticum]|uniref:PEP-CTERM sorting domain-containing protein n=1 Tax=Ferribacterium limneticum TaxID=76259 RepID=UPI001CFA0807|nr:PEP-CTERM sorting domain-containing protein [Ferribacterium limneticum]UCV17970.1 PEP-CTERM sorting domain-containing protein [Ferribacterium limneticum]